MRHILLAATFVLYASYSDGIETMPATSAEACYTARDALLAGVWTPVGRTERPSQVVCKPGNAFKPGWDVIRGYNDK